MQKIFVYKMQHIQEKFLMVKDMEKEFKFGTMELNMKETGKMINQMDMVLFIIQMEMYIKDFGKIIEQMERGYI